MKIVTIVGARPQFIKAAVVNRAIRRHNESSRRIIEEVIVHTGQHYDKNMSDMFFEELDIDIPKYNLEIGLSIKENPTVGTQIALMLVKIEKILNLEKPDMVLLYGDTNSTLAGALIAAKMSIPIAHVEAGVRNYDKHNTEEQNRIITDQMASVLFCPTQSAVQNLNAEGIYENVVFSGDVMYDAYLHEWAKCGECKYLLDKYNLERDNYILLTIHRDENVNITTVKKILVGLEDLEEKIIFPIHPRTKKLIEKHNIKLSRNIILVQPLGYKEILFLQRYAKTIITDSGGIQKEAYFSRTPCITMMNETSWKETVDSGWNILTKDNYAFKKYMGMHQVGENDETSLFGRGDAGDKIITYLINKYSRSAK